MTGIVGNNVASTSAEDGNPSGTIVVTGRAKTDAIGGKLGSGYLFVEGVGGGTTNCAARLCLFADGAGGTKPGALVAITDEVVFNAQASVWVPFSGWTKFGGAPNVLANTFYWPGIWWGTQAGAGTLYIFGLSASQTLAYDQSKPYSATANPNPTWNVDVGLVYDLYFDYAPAGTSVTLTVPRVALGLSSRAPTVAVMPSGQWLDAVCGVAVCGESVCGLWYILADRRQLSFSTRPVEVRANQSALVPRKALGFGSYPPTLNITNGPDQIPQAGLRFLTRAVSLSINQTATVPRAGLGFGTRPAQPVINKTVAVTEAGLRLGSYAATLTISSSIGVEQAGFLFGVAPGIFAGQEWLWPFDCLSSPLPAICAETTICGTVVCGGKSYMSDLVPLDGAGYTDPLTPVEVGLQPVVCL